MAKIFVIIYLLLAATTSFAQSKNVMGYLRDSITHFPLSGTVKNNNSNKSVRCDETGFFRIAAYPNDLIYALSPGYQFDTIRYSSIFADTIQLFLSPAGSILPTVTVTSGYTKYQIDSADRATSFLENRGTMVKTISRPNSNGFGIGFNLDKVFKKEERGKKTYTISYKKREEQAYIDYRFSPKLVAFYTGLKGEALRQFLYQYAPSFQWLRQHTTNEEVLFYINEKLKLFRITKPA